MNSLKLESFLSSDTDWEKNQYKVLGGIKKYLNAFNKQKLYPALSELIELTGILEDIRNHKKLMKGSFPKQITEYDIRNKKIIYETIEKLSPDVEFLFDLIDWALPLLKNAIEEGIVLYEYVEKNLRIENVGVVPLYKNEGYFLIPDNTSETVQVHRFECSLFESGKEPFRALKTRLIDAIEKVIVNTPETIKLDLIKRFKDLPNPATFFCVTDLDFPFTETLFPVAKRKLMGRVAEG